MTPEALRAEIAQRVAADVIASRNTTAIAAALTQARQPRIVSREIGIGTILAVLAPNGGVFLDGIEALGQADRNAHWAMELLRQGRLDIGMAATRAQMQDLADANEALQAPFAALLALAEEPDPVGEFEVRQACWSDAGEWLL